MKCKSLAGALIIFASIVLLSSLQLCSALNSIFGGLLFIGGAIMYSIGTLGFADMDVQANYMLAPQYLGIATMLVGAALGFFGLKKD